MTSLSDLRSLPLCVCTVATRVNILKCSSNYKCPSGHGSRTSVSLQGSPHSLLIQSTPLAICTQLLWFPFLFLHSFICTLKSHRGIAYPSPSHWPIESFCTFARALPSVWNNPLCSCAEKNGLWSRMIWRGLERMAGFSHKGLLNQVKEIELCVKEIGKQEGLSRGRWCACILDEDLPVQKMTWRRARDGNQLGMFGIRRGGELMAAVG